MTCTIKYVRAFAQAWPDPAIVQAAHTQITWYHNLALLEELRSPEERLWYASATVQHGWSRNVLVHQIESGLHHRQGQALTNFERTLPAPQSEPVDPGLRMGEVVLLVGFIQDGAPMRHCNNPLARSRAGRPERQFPVQHLFFASPQRQNDGPLQDQFLPTCGIRRLKAREAERLVA